MPFPAKTPNWRRAGRGKHLREDSGIFHKMAEYTLKVN